MTLKRKPLSPALPKKVKGITLVETLLALSVGAAMLTSGIYAMNEYGDGLRNRAAADRLSRLNKAASLYSRDNYHGLVLGAPQKIDISALEPYFAGPIGSDSFKSSHYLTTTTYTIQIPDGSGGTIPAQALHMLVVGEGDGSDALSRDSTARTEIAATSGVGGGWISTANAGCLSATGTAMPAGSVCGAFDAYAFRNSDFPAADLSNAVYVSLATEGDAAVHGDQMYRFDLGDPEINTMHTDIHFGRRNIIGVDEITNLNSITVTTVPGIAKGLRADGAALSIRTADDGQLTMAPGNGLVNITQTGSEPPKITMTASALHIGDNDETVSVGPLADDTINLNGTSDTIPIGTETFSVRSTSSNRAKAHRVNSLHSHVEDPLRLQDFHNGEVIVGKRTSYTPDGSTARYDLSDGKITARYASLQDLDCADCGGALSNILPKWRHVGTYFVEDQGYQATGTVIPKPDCNGNRRSHAIRSSNGEDPAYDENAEDERFEARIILVPQKFGHNTENDTNPAPGDAPASVSYTHPGYDEYEILDGQVEWHFPAVPPKTYDLGPADYASNGEPQFSFYAIDNGNNWTAYPDVYNAVRDAYIDLSGVDPETDTAALVPILNEPGKAGPGVMPEDSAADPSHLTDSVLSSRPSPDERSGEFKLFDPFETYTGRVRYFPKRMEHYTDATAYALTYCVFLGGENPDPTSTGNGLYPDDDDPSMGYRRIE